MKTYRNLYPQIYAFDNLLAAFYKARKGKRSKASVARFEYNLEQEILNLERELQDKTYRPGPNVTPSDWRGGQRPDRGEPQTCSRLRLHR